MIALAAFPIVAVVSYLLGVRHGVMIAESRVVEGESMMKNELVELRKWKADNIGKEKA